MKRILSILLLCSMLFLFSACNNGEEPHDSTSDTTAKTDETTAASDIYYEPDDLPIGMNFDTTIKILACDGEGDVEEISVEDLTSDVVNDSIYNRERYVEERLGVEIEVYSAGLDTELEKQMASDEDNFQIVSNPVYILSENLFRGYYTDLYTVEHINFDKPWWPKDFAEAAEIDGCLYFASGSLARSLIQNLWAIYFNKTLTESYSSDIPEMADIYGLVERGEWTIDKLIELSTGIYIDSNGSTTEDEEDLYGLGFHSYIGTDPLWTSFDINIFSKSDDGWFEVDIDTEKLYDALEKLRYVAHDMSGCYVAEDSQPDSVLIEYLAPKFAGSTLVFKENKLNAAETPTLRNMKDDYGIVPFPKYDEKQKEYYSHAHDNYTVFAIPTTNQKLEATGAVLEAMASYSYRETIPAYLNVALKGQYMSDPISRRMIDMIVDGLRLDTAWMYVYTLGGSFNDSFRKVIFENKTTYASTYTTTVKKIERDLKIYKLAYEKLFE